MFELEIINWTIKQGMEGLIIVVFILSAKNYLSLKTFKSEIARIEKDAKIKEKIIEDKIDSMRLFIKDEIDDLKTSLNRIQLLFMEKYLDKH